MNEMSSIKISFITFFITLFVISCGSKNQIRPGDTLEVAYEKAMRMYEKEKYTDSARAFETVLSIGRGTELAQEAQYLLAESYFKNRDYLVAAAEYGRYYTNYPRSEKRIDAEFKEAMCYVELSPRYKLDQTDTYKALELMQLFIGRYPNTQRATDAATIVDELRNKLAQKEFSSAELYMRINAFEAAAVYYGLTIDQFPETEWAEKALAKQALAYLQFAQASIPTKQLERYQKAVESYQKYLQLFPQGANRSLIETYYDTAMDGIRSLQSASEG
jgi:outer membrane protein assembly factor BamD